MLWGKKGIWETNPKEISRMIIEFYKELFLEEMINREIMLIVRKFPIINNSQFKAPNSNVSMVEIRRSIFAIGVTKALRIDGYFNIFIIKSRR